jgi:hypothetical protein
MWSLYRKTGCSFVEDEVPFLNVYMSRIEKNNLGYGDLED